MTSRSQVVKRRNTLFYPDWHYRGPQGPKERPTCLKEVNKDIARMGVKVLQQFVLLIKYDLLKILEAPDHGTVAKVMVELGSRGTMETIALAVIPIEDFLKALE